ncbi:hypothetical protein EC988_002164, partial [Linderina pennispora]
WKKHKHQRDLNLFSEDSNLRPDRLNMGGTGFADDDLPPAYDNTQDNNSFVIETKTAAADGS